MSILKYFKFDHLPGNLQKISRDVCLVAEKMSRILPDSAEKSAGLRKLLEAKDCFVRTAVDMPVNNTPPYQQIVIDELYELDVKLIDLLSFIGSDAFVCSSVPEQKKLNRQENIMLEYKNILEERIRDF